MLNTWKKRTGIIENSNVNFYQNWSESFDFLLPKISPWRHGGVWISEGTRSKIYVAQVGSGQPSLVCVWHWKISLLNRFGSKKVSSGWVKKYPGQPLIYCRSEVCSGWVRASLVWTGLKSFLVYFLTLQTYYWGWGYGLQSFNQAYNHLYYIDCFKLSRCGFFVHSKLQNPPWATYKVATV